MVIPFWGCYTWPSCNWMGSWYLGLVCRMVPARTRGRIFLAVCLVGAVAAVVIAVAAPRLEDALLVLALVLVRLTLVVRPYTTNKD